MILRPIINNNYLLRFCNGLYDGRNPNNNTGNIPANGASLSSAIDLGNLGNNLSQATGTNQPVYLHNAVNGNNVFQFDGNDYLSCANSANNNRTGAMSVIFVCTTTVLSGVGCIFANCGAGNGGFIFGRSGDKLLFTIRGVADYTTTAAQFALNTWAAYIITYNGTNSVSFYKNNAPVETIATSTIVSSSFPFNFGSFDGLQAFWTGNVLLGGWAFRVWNAAEINYLFTQAMGLAGL